MANKKDRNRAKREEARAAAERRRKKRLATVWIAGGLAAVVIVAIVAVNASSKSNGSPTSSTELARLVSQAPAAETAAGCTPVNDVASYSPTNPDLNHAHIGQAPVLTAPSLATYPSTPPADGPHDPVPQDAGVYSSPPPIYKMIHSLEHGAVEFWFAPSVGSSQLAAVESFVRQNQDHAIVAPYSYPGNASASLLPSGYDFALVSWEKLQLCKSVPSTAVIANFMARYRWPTLGGGQFQGTTDPKLEKGAPI
jgi:hypothetical protein